jgi:hypothetical protein
LPVCCFEAARRTGRAVESTNVASASS